MASPPGTASAPSGGVKSFWKSTITSARAISLLEAQECGDAAVLDQALGVLHDDDLGALLYRLLHGVGDHVVDLLHGPAVRRRSALPAEHAGARVAYARLVEVVADE